jgi:hypothetical protein
MLSCSQSSIKPKRENISPLAFVSLKLQHFGTPLVMKVGCGPLHQLMEALLDNHHGPTGNPNSALQQILPLLSSILSLFYSTHCNRPSSQD